MVASYAGRAQFAFAKPQLVGTLGQPDKKYLFLYVFDFNSSVARKNPMAAVNAFKQAFPQADKSVGLVLKTMNTNPANPEWQDFLKECKADKRIYVLTETMDRPDVLGLIDCCDAYVSTHRAEGFGRTIAEAIMLNKPVIATHYSGNVDFFVKNSNSTVALSKINQNEYQWIEASDDAVWADINIDHVASYMFQKSGYKTAMNFSDRSAVSSIALQMKSILLK